MLPFSVLFAELEELLVKASKSVMTGTGTKKLRRL
jgi:hypothetical protein